MGPFLSYVQVPTSNSSIIYVWCTVLTLEPNSQVQQRMVSAFPILKYGERLRPFLFSDKVRVTQGRDLLQVCFSIKQLEYCNKANMNVVLSFYFYRSCSALFLS